MIFANWKENGSIAMIEDWTYDFLKATDDELLNNVDVGIAPSYIHIQLFKNLLEKAKVMIGSQDVDYGINARTSKVSASMLKDFDVNFSIIGHSEVRNLFNDSNEIIRKKFKTLISDKIQPILCIGESENEFNAKQTRKVLENQLYSVLEGVNVENCIIAYEPVWAIGTGKTPEVNLVNDIHEHIKDVVQSATTNNFLPNVIYGGSLNEGNASSFFGQTHIDGSLVGGASLNAESFVKIIKEYNKVK